MCGFICNEELQNYKLEVFIAKRTGIQLNLNGLITARVTIDQKRDVQSKSKFERTTGIWRLPGHYLKPCYNSSLVFLQVLFHSILSITLQLSSKAYFLPFSTVRFLDWLAQSVRSLPPTIWSPVQSQALSKIKYLCDLLFCLS